MQRALWLSIVFWLLAGCAGAGTPRPTASAVAGTAAAAGLSPLTALTRNQDEQQKRIVELESRLSLLESEARRQRGAGALAPTETIRIRERPRAQAQDDLALAPVDGVEEPQASELDRDADGATPGRRERVPSLRLYGAPPSAAATRMDIPERAPALPVMPLPEERAGALVQPAAEEATKLEYKEALRLLRGRRYDDALAAFDRFVVAHSSSALVGHALYWRGEAHYAKREYALAREAFETLLARFGSSEKAADSMLKVGLCLRRLGDEERAKVYFRRVQENYPNTQAAQVASREGST